MAQYAIIDRRAGVPEASLETLEDILKKLSIQYGKGDPVRVYELRNFSCPDSTGISFYFNAPNMDALVGESFWVPGRKSYKDLTEADGGSGTWAYQRAIPLIYRYLNKQPRLVVNIDDEVTRLLFSRDMGLDARIIEKAPVDRVEEENWHITPKLWKDLGFDSSFIFLDIETTRNLVQPKYRIAATWDLYYGLKDWEEGQESELIEECMAYDNIVTFNGDVFDLKMVLAPKLAPEKRGELMRKSVDLYSMISNAHARAEERVYRKKGELTLANIAFATLGVCKWEVYHGPTEQERREPIDDGLIDHCMRDVEMLRDLFFYMSDKPTVYHITHDALGKGKVIEPVHGTFSWILKQGLKTYRERFKS